MRRHGTDSRRLFGWASHSGAFAKQASPVARKTLAVVLIYILVAGQIPVAGLRTSAAWAGEAVAAAPAAGEAGAQAGTVSTDAADKDASADTATDGTSDNSGATDNGDVSDNSGMSGAGEGSSQGPSSGTGEAGNGAAGNGATSSVESTAVPVPQADTSDQSGASDEPATDAAENRVLSADAFLLIQDTKDAASSWSYTSGAVSAGAVLWANMYERQGYSDTGVAAEADWTYQWYASDTKSNNIDDYEPISGQTDQSLVLTDELADQLAGKYIAVTAKVDGVRHIGPASSYTAAQGNLNANYLPGPVMRAGTAELYKVELSNASPSVGDTLTATAYSGYSTEVGENVDVTYTWQQGDSRYGTFTDIEGAGDGNTFKLTADQQGKYIKVIANAGVNDVNATTSDAVAAEGAVKLAGVELEKPDSLQMPITLTAKAYTGSSYNPTYVDNAKVTYTWKYSMEDPTSYSFDESSWQVVQGANGPAITLNDEKYANAYFSVEANAGANTVELSSYNAVGPVKLKGQVDIYSAFLAADAGASSGSYVYTSDQTVYAKAKEKGAGTVTIASENLAYQWQVSWTSRAESDAFENIDGATSESLELAKYEGAYVRCVITAKVGGSTYTTTATVKVAAPGSVNVTSVRVNPTGKVNVGDTLAATATASTGDVTSNERVTWSWYYGDSASDIDTKIEGATGSTLVVTDTLLGKYIEARADGGFGEEASTGTIGPVVEPGSVELYQVVATGDARVGSTLTATAYKSNAYTEVSETDKVYYQWQYADNKTTSDSAFKDIPNATSATYVITADRQGKYLRVKATSDGSVVSTKKPSYYGGSTLVDPIGPVMLEGQYTLTGVELESSGQAGQSGNTITPTAMVEGGYNGDDPAPADAKLTFTWEVLGEDGAWSNLEGVSYDASTGKLTLDDSLVGKRLRVRASALDNEVASTSFIVLAKDTYSLLRVTTSPLINGAATQLFTGDTVTAMVQAQRLDGSSTNGDDVTKHVSVQWYASGEKDGEFIAIDGANTAELTLTPDLAGKYLKAVATSSSSQVGIVSANPVVDAGSLEGIVAKLENEDWRLELTYGVDVNANDVLAEKLADMGVEDVTVRTAAVEVSNPNDAATLGISTDDADNGAVTYFFMDPDDLMGWGGFTTYQTFTPTFELSRGDETVEFTPGRTTTMPWDEARLTEMLEADAAEALAIDFAAGDTAESVTQDMTLPLELAGKSWSEVSWASSNEDAVKITGNSWDDTNTGKVSRLSNDTEVTLTASVGITKSGAPELTVDVPFKVTVKADPEAVEQAKAELQAKVDAAFAADKLAYAEDGSAIDPAAVAGDLQLPRPGTIGIDGKYYTVEYAASNSTVEVNGYRGNVYQPLPGEAATQVAITLTVTSKDNPEVAASRAVELTVAPLEADDIEAELALMEAAKAGYAAAILNDQNADAVAGNLATFQKAYLDKNGDVAWARDYATANAAGDGVVTDDLEPDDDMGVIAGHWFKSSDATVIAHDTLLLVAQPKYNTKVTVRSSLSSERYARYAERYAGDAAWGDKLARLSGQEVSATFTVTGTTGADDPSPTAQLKATVTFVTADGKDILAKTEFTADKGQTAWDATAGALDAAGYTYQGGGVLESVTAPDGRQWGSAAENWRLFINGEYSDVYASNHLLADGDEVTWVYSADGSAVDLPKGDVELNPDAEHPNLDAQWNGFANGDAGAAVENDATPSIGAEDRWVHSLLTDEERAAGASASVSDALIVDGKLYVVSASAVYGTEPPYAATKSLARLQVIDPATGKVERSATLARAMDSQCRPVYADGIIVIPLAGGYLQAVSASTLETIWVVDGIDGAQSLSSLTVSDGYVYVATADALDGSYVASAGTVRRVNLYTGAIAGTASSDTTGYYWAGGVSADGFYVVGDDSGTVTVYSGDLSEQVSSVKITGSVRSTIVQAEGCLFAVTSDGVLHKLALDGAGRISEVASVKFGSSSTSTPTVAGGKVYVGGSSAEGYANDWGGTSYYGVLAVIDAATMTVEQSVTSCDGGKLPADVKSAPLVSSRTDGTYVYFTCNSVPGGMYMYRLGDGSASLCYLPDEANRNYATSSVLCGPDGTLYYVNDSGNLFALRASDKKPEHNPDDPSDKPVADPDTDPVGPSDGQQGGQAAGLGAQAGMVPASSVPAGAVAPGQQPVSTGDASAADAATTAVPTSATADERRAEKGAAAVQSAFAAGWLPIVGIAVGVAGLVAVAVWWQRSRRRG